MPTPSSNPPPDPHSPRSHSFSTCPEDSSSRPPQRSWRPPTDANQGPAEMDTHHDDRMDEGASPAPVSAPMSQAEGMSTEVILDDEPTSAVSSSSRSTTMSPRPQSGDTAHSSPVADMGSFKHAESDEEGHSAGERLRTSRRDGTRRHDPRLSPTSVHDDGKDMEVDVDDVWEEELMAPSMGSDFSNMRIIPSTASSFLRPGSKFHGTQQSERQVYDVQVEIKHVDLRESFLCGYLRIQGLTEDHPTLTTYFEGEIIGTKYSFITNHESWGATDKIDLNHWAKFNAFRPFQKQARKGPVVIRDVAQRENIFMRWKEHFLVPDHRVRTISGASFEGFYYICFNQVKGEVSGIYFHSKSEKFQQLELKHVEDRGCFGAMEFR
ncbi:vacuolar import and degradation protein [Colletotrichum tofieldiae]|uniref:Vacuolar import and degradation protein n=1 Tax=Colletotrichum tofieldiae TaxID=708197 RepID=A0A166PNK8_9PEZI|nr:vacuolar import and degradation protein [Colletotrichum tofieldiae]GKT54503.1 vacuolar import and degradation protein [Colletotrichum tofieldiae]GKT81283.1 vacuolar import and degradation protein [Colletotrichum tofieldiae]